MDTISTVKFAKGNENVGRVMVLNLCMSFDDALYLYQGSKELSQRVSELLRGHDCHSEIFEGALFHKNVGRV